MTIAVGQCLGPYELLAPLGAGGMGVVWRALDARLRREVAIKFLSPALAGDADAVRRFEREARAAAALSHPGILSLFDVGSHEGSPFLVTELLRGATLRDRLADGPLAASAAAALGRDVASALRAAHAAGIVHRDIKPENLFLGEDGRVKLLDFGLASFAESGRAGSRLSALTGTGMVMGTVGYVAPEQLRGEGVGPAADLFSLGCVLYECCCGASPFRKASIAATFHAIAHESPPDLAGQSGVPQTLSSWIARCLDKDPARRPTAAELAAGLGVGAAPDAASAPTQLFGAEVAASRPGRRVRIGLVAAGAAAAVATIVALLLTTRSGQQRGSAKAEPAAVMPARAAPEASRSDARGTTDEEAWRLFVRARHAWEQRGAGMLEARDLFKAAVDRDPTFARAWLGLAETFAILHDYAPVPASESFPKARAAALRALELDPSLSGAHTVLGYVAHKFERDAAESERQFRAALAGAPSDAKALQWYAELLASEGRVDESIATIRAARAADPLAPMIAATEVWLLLILDRPAEAIEVADRARDFAEFGPLRAYRALSLILVGRGGEGLAELEPLSRAGVSPVIEIWHAYALAATGDPGRARERFAESLRAHDERDLNRYYRAYLQLALGERDTALAELERSIAAREEQVAWMKVDPHLVPLRAEPRFAELLRVAGFER